MRRSVFLSVWLSLVLSLSKGTSAQASNTTTVSTTSTSAAETTTTAPVTTTTTPSTTVTTNSPSPAENTTTPPVATTTKPNITVTTISPGTSAQASNTTTVSTTLTSAAENTTTPPVATTTKPNTTVTTISPGTSAQASNTTTVSTTSTSAAENTTTPPVATTTKPNTTVTTISPGTSAQASNTTTVSTTSTSAAENTTTPPVATTTKPNITVTTISPVLVDFCHGDPCGKSSAKCISLKSNYTCECSYGFYYENQNCYRGKVFPATIAVRASYSGSVTNVSSTEYEEVFHNVSKFFEEAFKVLDGYVETVIVEIQLPKATRNSAPLNVTVTNLFTWNSPVDETSVKSAVANASNAAGNQSYVYSYNVTKHCAIYECDNKTTECHEDMFPECRCKIGLEKTDWDDHSCSACSKNCSAEAHKYCVREKGVPTCKCMTNFQEEGENCVPCPVGYSGDRCSDNSELILIIVGTVFGAIILSLVIAVAIISVRAKRNQSPEKRNLIKPGYSDLDTSDDRPTMFPRVQTTSGHANPGYQPNNPYEMRSSNRGHFPDRDYDDLFEASREPRGFRMQSGY